MSVRRSLPLEDGLAVSDGLGFLWRPADGFAWEERPSLGDGPRGAGPLGLWLVPHGARVAFRVPRGHGFLERFAALPSGIGPSGAAAPGDLDAIRRYADRYGWLGAEETGSLAPRAPRWEIEAGEPAGVWERHIGQVRELLHTIADVRTLEAGSEARLHKPLWDRFRWQDGRLFYGSGLLWPIGATTEGAKLWGLFPGSMPTDKLIPYARMCVQTILQYQLASATPVDTGWAHSHFGVVFPPQQHGTPEMVPGTLTGALYWQLARELLGWSPPERRCRTCQRHYPPTRKGHQFCSSTCRKKYERQQDRLHPERVEARAAVREVRASDQRKAAAKRVAMEVTK